jgi:hypothetical protein
MTCALLLRPAQYTTVALELNSCQRSLSFWADTHTRCCSNEGKQWKVHYMAWLQPHLKQYTTSKSVYYLQITSIGAFYCKCKRD